MRAGFVGQNFTEVSLFDPACDLSTTTPRSGNHPTASPYSALSPTPPQGVQGGRALDGDAGEVSLRRQVLSSLKGAIVISEMTDADRARISENSDRRGWLLRNGPTSNTQPRVKRSVRDEAQLTALCQWLNGNSIDILGTVTYSPAYAAAHSIHNLKRALDDVERGLKSMPMCKGKFTGYSGRWVLSGEWHPSGRLVPHVHLALDSMGIADKGRVLDDLWRYFHGTRGRCRFELMRDCDTATLYGLKDTIKASEHDPDSLRIKLGRHSNIRRNPK